CSFWCHRPSVERPPNKWVRGAPIYTALSSRGWIGSSRNHGYFAGLKASINQSIICRTLGMRPLVGAGLPFEIIDPPAHGVDWEAEPVGRGAEAATTHDFQEDARRVPICETGGRNLAFLLGNAPFRGDMHTSPFRLLNLAEYCANHN